MRKKLNHFLYSLLFLFFVFTAKAQYPVQVTTQMLSPYSLNLSDYYTGTTPKMYVTLTNRDLQQPSLNIRLKMTISGQQATLSTNDFVKYPSINLDAGIPQRLSLNDLAPYFNPTNLDFGGITKAEYLRTNKLPEGFYTFCFQAIENNTNKAVSDIACTTVWISLSDPPILNSPINTSRIYESNLLNIIFNWTPRHLGSPNSAFNTQYEFELKEIWDNGVDPQAAFLSAKSVYKTTTSNTKLIYGVNEPLLFVGKKYAWRVRVISNNADDKDQFKNNGYSDIFWFEYRKSCAKPVSYLANTINSNTVSISVTNGVNINDNIVEYRQVKPVTSEWKTTPRTNINPITINDLNAGGTYQYKVASACEGNFFEFGDTKEIKLNNTVSGGFASNTVQIKGKVVWSFYKINNNTPPKNIVEKLPIGTTEDCSIEKKLENTPSNLQGARVVAYTQNKGSLKEIGSGFTDANGIFRINIFPTDLKNSTSGSGKIIIKAQAQNGFANEAILEKQFNTGTPVSKIIETDFLIQAIPNTFLLEPRITANNIATIQNLDLNIDVLLSEADWNNGYKRLPVVLEQSVPKKVQYNNQNYYVLANLTNGAIYNRLIQKYNYILKVNAKGQEPIYEYLNSVNGYCNIKRVIDYSIKTVLKGNVTCKENPKEGVMVSMRYNNNDAVDPIKNIGSTTLTTRSNNLGEYLFNNIPQLKPNSKINILCTYKTLREEPFEFEYITQANSINTYNIKLVNEVATFIGRLVDQNNFPVSNALITVNNQVLQNRTGKTGFFIFKTNYDPNKIVKFNADGYEDLRVELKAFNPGDATSKVG